LVSDQQRQNNTNCKSLATFAFLYFALFAINISCACWSATNNGKIINDKYSASSYCITPIALFTTAV
jgi:hypothetical protein